MADTEAAAGAVVTVLLDPGDDAAVTGRLLDAHCPPGVVVVHPTPAVRAPGLLARDVLAALGRPVSDLSEQQVSGSGPAWSAVAAWMSADAVALLVVLRAHVLSGAGWEALVEAHRRTGAGLVLVCHTRSVPKAGAEALGTVAYQVTDEVDHLVAAQPPPAEPEPAGAQAVGLPELPPSDFSHFRADAYRRLSAADFTRVDAVYQHGRDAACAWAASHAAPNQEEDQARWVGFYLREVMPPYLDPWQAAAAGALLESRYDPETLRQLAGGLLCRNGSAPTFNRTAPFGDPDAVAVLLAGLVAQSPSRSHSVALIRGAQAGFFLHGMLLAITMDLTRDAVGPGMTGVAFTDAHAERIRASLAGPVHAAAVAAAMFTGLGAEALRAARISGLSEDAAMLRVANTKAPDRTAPSGALVPFVVPPAARPLLIAARTFLHLRGYTPGSSLLSAGIGHKAAALATGAERCALALPATTADLDEVWHARARAHWIGSSLHRAEREQTR